MSCESISTGAPILRDQSLSVKLLEWYDEYGRNLPWRVRGASERKPDPYLVWLSEIMLQQTTVAAVKPYFQRFVELWPTVRGLASADEAQVMSEWAGLGYYSRARNLIKCARIVAWERGGEFPSEQSGLLSLPGIGPYTAAAISSIAFGRRATVVDGNVERVIARMRLVRSRTPSAKKEIRAIAEDLTPMERVGDYAQALMDLGATVCRPRNPNCEICPWMECCMARKGGVQNSIPEPRRKSAKPVRTGTAFVARRQDGAWLLERRPEKGLLGGMLGWPCSGWDGRESWLARSDHGWKSVDGEVLHTFTHFHLQLSVKVADIEDAANAGDGVFIDSSEFDPRSLPNLMRKVYEKALPYFEPNAVRTVGKAKKNDV